MEDASGERVWRRHLEGTSAGDIVQKASGEGVGRKHHEEDIWRRQEETSWRIRNGGGILEDGIMEETSRRRYHGGGM